MNASNNRRCSSSSNQALRFPTQKLPRNSNMSLQYLKQFNDLQNARLNFKDDKTAKVEQDQRDLSAAAYFAHKFDFHLEVNSEGDACQSL
mmetsp:Transcript_8754/g.14848  ORF Transcript_8754/g.14848 Transcript_8754/m.14848 type:complete len:90 (-) Transcript_8754:362-631(-)